MKFILKGELVYDLIKPVIESVLDLSDVIFHKIHEF